MLPDLPRLFAWRYALVPIALHIVTQYAAGEKQAWRVLRVFGLRLALWRRA